MEQYTLQADWFLGSPVFRNIGWPRNLRLQGRSNTECQRELRFAKEDLHLLFECLQVPCTKNYLLTANRLSRHGRTVHFVEKTVLPLPLFR